MYILPNSQCFLPDPPYLVFCPKREKKECTSGFLWGSLLVKWKELVLSWLTGFAVHCSSHFMLDRAEKLFSSSSDLWYKSSHLEG